jgi:hypothetical protein
MNNDEQEIGSTLTGCCNESNKMPCYLIPQFHDYMNVVWFFALNSDRLQKRHDLVESPGFSDCTYHHEK